MAERVLILGGARSGKSAVAESLVAGVPVVYVATGAPADAELADRMTAHGLWVAPGVEVAPLGTAGRAAFDAVLAEAGVFWRAAARHPGGPVVLVADESGFGVTPADPSTRRWLDLSGALTQLLAASADRVLVAVAGRTAALSTPPQYPRLTRQGPGLHGDRMVPEGALDFAVSVHGDGPPPHLRAALDKALDDAGRYPDPTAATAAAARRHGRSPAEVLVTAGAAEAFRLLPAALRIRRAVVVAPTFTEPEDALHAAGVAVEHVVRDRERDWALDPGAVPADADLVVLGSPNNPTGTLDDPERVAALCRSGRVTVVDEAFADFVPGEGAGLAGRADLPGLVVVRSVTKLWGVPGLRAGYLLAPPGLVARLAGVRQPWPVGVDALAAVTACCDDEAYRRAVAATVEARRARLTERLAALPRVRVWPSAANFLLLAVPDGPAVDAALRQRGIAVRPSTFPHLSADHLRVAVRDEERNDRLVAALTEVLA